MIKFFVKHVVDNIRYLIKHYLYKKKLKKINLEINIAKKEAEDAKNDTDVAYDDFNDIYKQYLRRRNGEGKDKE